MAVVLARPSATPGERSPDSTNNDGANTKNDKRGDFRLVIARFHRPISPTENQQHDTMGGDWKTSKTAWTTHKGATVHTGGYSLRDV